MVRFYVRAIIVFERLKIGVVLFDVSEVVDSLSPLFFVGSRSIKQKPGVYEHQIASQN